MIGKNNPFNIRNNRRNKWLGQIGSKRGFCNFASLDHGIRAAGYILMLSYRRFGIVTIQDIVSRWAPPSENDTENYISYCCNQTGFLRNTELFCLEDYIFLLVAMSKMEGNPLTLEQVKYSLLYFGISPLPKP